MIGAVLGYCLVKSFKSNLKFNLHVHIKICCFLAILFPSFVLKMLSKSETGS